MFFQYFALRMKNIGATLLLIFVFASTANAQLAIAAGLNLANMSLKFNDTKIPTQFKKSGTAGIFGDIAMGNEEHLYFEPGLFLDVNGCTPLDADNKPTGDFSVFSITIPINFEYKSGTKCTRRFFFGGGPYVASNNSGSYSIPAQGAYKGSSGDLIIGSNPGANLKGIDVGFGANAGYMTRSRFFLRLRYQAGIFNLLPGGDSKNSIRISSFAITLGKAFGRCREGGGRSVFGVRKTNHWRGLSKGVYSTRPKPPRYPQQ
jgi:outer membrane protein with beta-barrel domain